MKRHSRRRPGIPGLFLRPVTAALLLLMAKAGTYGNFPNLAIDAITLPDSIAFPLAEAFLHERNAGCEQLPGAIVAPGGDSACTHPLDRYVLLRNDSVVIQDGGKTMLAAYEAFRRVERSERSYSFVHKEFLSFVRPPEPPAESWISRQVKRLLGWTFMHLFRFLAPWLAKAWDELSSPGRMAVIALAALLVLLFFVFSARALSRSRFIQRRLAPDVPPTIKTERKTDWLAEADERLRRGHCREALTFLYCWVIAWTVERGMVRRQEWWTNRQLITALGRSRPAVRDLAQTIVAAYEATEYGHLPADAATVNNLRDRIRLESRGGRP